MLKCTRTSARTLWLCSILHQREKDLFLKLISISGIGPKLAVSILSGARVEEARAGIAEGNLLPAHRDPRSRAQERRNG